MDHLLRQILLGLGATRFDVFPFRAIGKTPSKHNGTILLWKEADRLEEVLSSGPAPIR